MPLRQIARLRRVWHGAPREIVQAIGETLSAAEAVVDLRAGRADGRVTVVVITDIAVIIGRSVDQAGEIEVDRFRLDEIKRVDVVPGALTFVLWDRTVPEVCLLAADASAVMAATSQRLRRSQRSRGAVSSAQRDSFAALRSLGVLTDAEFHGLRQRILTDLASKPSPLDE